MEFELSFETKKTTNEAVDAIRAALAERNFSILFHMNLNEKLAEKGLTLKPEVHILEVCNARKAKEAIETNPLVAYFLPCKIIVSKLGEQTKIGLAKPTMLMSVLGDTRMKALAEEIEATLTEALRAAC